MAIFSFSVVFAQKDTLFELRFNGVQNAFYNAIYNTNNSPYLIKNKPKDKTALTLPFVDDFSQHYLYPNPKLWQDFDVFINSNYPINPVTYGVATFDGLDSTGTPYDFGTPTAYGVADQLTSMPINLNTISDSVFLSFYYQPQGNGNRPETKDSLRLEFFRQRDSSWVRMWGTPGLPNQAFKKIMIPVDTSFHNDEFQFRFTNWATLSGNVDHWHVDYIYLNDNRNYTDTLLHDVSFITNHHNMINEFTAMPWQHFLTDTIGMMKPTMPITYKNNDSVSNYLVVYKYEVIENNGAGASIEKYPVLPENKPVSAYGVLTEPQAIYDVSNNNFSFPADFAAENKVFQIKNYFNLIYSGGTSGIIPDSLTKNDTVVSYQVFGSYYAYDDGSAEQGYGIQGIGSKLAHEFNIKKTDTLTAFQIYFNPIQDDLSAQTFRLKVWSSLSPETEIYSQPATAFTSPTYSRTNQFLNYPLDVPLILNAGTYYFGWEKISSEFLNVGWDVNTNNKTKVHFNASGSWETSNFDGSLMLRPVFGTSADPKVSVKAGVDITDFVIYPNPTRNYLYVKHNLNDAYHIQLIDVYGKVVLKTKSTVVNRINLTGIAEGVYFIRFVNEKTQQPILKKVIITD